MLCPANYSNNKGQMKIQQMAFVLVALMILFAIGSLFYISVRSSSLKGDVEDAREREVIEVVRSLAGSPEFKWGAYDCAYCLDLDKILVLKERNSYKGFWKGIVYLEIDQIYPEKESVECSRGNYPDCSKITLIEEEGSFVSHSAFVSLCRNSEGGYKCSLGKIIAGFETIK